MFILLLAKLSSSSGVVVTSKEVSKLLVAPSTPESDLFGRVLEDIGTLKLSIFCTLLMFGKKSKLLEVSGDDRKLY